MHRTHGSKSFCLIETYIGIDMQTYIGIDMHSVVICMVTFDRFRSRSVTAWPGWRIFDSSRLVYRSVAVLLWQRADAVAAEFISLAREMGGEICPRHT